MSTNNTISNKNKGKMKIIISEEQFKTLANSIEELIEEGTHLKVFFLENHQGHSNSIAARS